MKRCPTEGLLSDGLNVVGEGDVGEALTAKKEIVRDTGKGRCLFHTEHLEVFAFRERALANVGDACGNIYNLDTARNGINLITVYILFGIAVFILFHLFREAARERISSDVLQGVRQGDRFFCGRAVGNGNASATGKGVCIYRNERCGKINRGKVYVAFKRSFADSL